MAERPDFNSEVDDDPFLSDWELSCLEEWNKGLVVDERRISAETEKSSHKLWSSFQNSASAVSQLYKDALQANGISLWSPFQSAAGHVTSLYKDSQELIRKSFELGNEMGHRQRSKELISWFRKRWKTLPREEIIAFICEKPVPSTKHNKRSSGSRRTYEITPSRFRVSTPVQDYSSNSNFQRLRDALALEGLSGSVANTTINLKPMPSPSNELCVSFMAEGLQCCTAAPQKRFRMSGETLDSPSHKRPKICVMETEDL